MKLTDRPFTSYRNIVYLLSGLGLVTLCSAETTIRAYFDPPEIALGDAARYILEIQESSDQGTPEMERIQTLPIPEISGLTLRNGRIGSSQQTRIVNGARTASITQTATVDAIPQSEGSYTIPSYKLNYEGEEYRVNAATLKVLERGADAGPGINDLVFLKADIPESLYLGQTVQTELKLYISSQVTLRGLNDFKKQADGFTTSDLPEQPSESSEIQNNFRYRVISWPIQLTPIRSGQQKIEFQLTISANVPNQNPRSNRNNSPFGSSIFDDFFGNASEQFNVYTDPLEVNVRSLPQAGKPASFSGAVGDFNLQVFADSDETNVGEPIMLSLKLTGTGNFDRINGPTFPEEANWRHYSPESSFEATDDTGMRGIKRFDYVFIPQQSGALQLPEVKFSFFDPETEEYVELSSPPIAVKVNPSLRPLAPVASKQSTQPSTPVPQTATQPEQPTLSLQDKLLTLDYQPEAGNQVDRNPLQSTWFWALNGLAAFVIIFVYGWNQVSKKRQQSANYAMMEKARQELKRAKKDIEAAIAQKAQDAFYRALQNYIRAKLSLRTGRDFSAATSHEIMSALQQTKLSEDSRETVQSVLEQANTLRFSGKTATTTRDEKMPATYQTLTTILKRL